MLRRVLTALVIYPDAVARDATQTKKQEAAMEAWAEAVRAMQS